MKRPAVLFFALFVYFNLAHAARSKVVKIVGTVISITQSNMAVMKPHGRLRMVVLINPTIFLEDDFPTPFKYIHTGNRVLILATKQRKELIAGSVHVFARR